MGVRLAGISLSCSSFIFENCSNILSMFVYKIIDFAKLCVLVTLSSLFWKKGIILKHINVIVSQQMVRTASPLRKVN